MQMTQIVVCPQGLQSRGENGHVRHYRVIGAVTDVSLRTVWFISDRNPNLKSLKQTDKQKKTFWAYLTPE